jgi:hypothetical protein
MALSIPIISEFNDKGIKAAVKQFKQLETVGQKAQFAIKKAAIPAAAAIAGIGAALVGATQAAIEDAAEQARLAVVMTNVTGASVAQVAAQEKVISAMSRASGTADSELRPAFQLLLLGTKDVTQANKLLALSQDIAQGSGLDLATVSDALAKAYGGNMRALGQLSPEIKAMIKDGATLEDVMNVLGGTFGGSVAASAETAAGKMKILKNSLDETKESIGAALLPAVEKVLPVVQKFADWAQNNPGAFLKIGGAIAGVAVAIVAVNVAMAANPFVLAAVGVGALAIALDQLYDKISQFNKLGGLAARVLGYVLGGSVTGIVGNIIGGLQGVMDGSKSSTQTPSSGAAREGGLSREVLRGRGMIPGLAAGGIVTSPTLAMIGEKGPEAIIPLNRAGGMGTTINVTGVLTEGQAGVAIVNALRRYNQTTGPISIRVAV